MGAIPDRTLEAVGACTRALAGLDHADAGLSESDAATVSGLRAYGDRLALRARHHTAAVHTRNKPAETPASDLFTAIEQARLDALGALWLPGIAKNLLAHPGRDDDALRWLAFEVFSGMAAPREKSAGVARLRGKLPPRLTTDLDGLSVHLRDQGAFAATAAEWARRAVPHMPPADTRSSTPLPFQLPQKNQRSHSPSPW